MCTLNVPTYTKHWPEDGLVKTEKCSQNECINDGTNHFIEY